MANPRADLVDLIVNNSADISLLYSSQEPPAFLAGSEKFLPVVGVGKAGIAESDSSLLEYFYIPFIEDSTERWAERGVSMDGTFSVVNVIQSLLKIDG